MVLRSVLEKKKALSPSELLVEEMDREMEDEAWRLNRFVCLKPYFMLCIHVRFHPAGPQLQNFLSK